jgi:hypothetical protein
MKRTKTIRISLFLVIVLIVIGLVVWTVTSPSTLAVQTKNQLENGLFSYSQDTVNYNMTDGSGTYAFKFGLDYSKNLTNDSPVKLTVYCALVNQEISSPFTRGVALALQSSSVSIDQRFDNSIEVTAKIISGLQTYSFVIPNLSTTSGNHSLQVNILVSTVDVNYIGNAGGTYQSVLLNGTFDVIQ